MTTKATRTAAPAPRRRPRQSRAQQTARALQDALVLLLGEREFADISIREIVSVAGTGLGSFYQYFASKDDLARVCLHLRSKALLARMQEAAAQRAGHAMSDIASAIVESMVEAHREHASEWDAHYLLERHLSSAQAYRKMYQRFVDGWAKAFAAAGDPLPAERLREAALVCQTVVYGLFAHAFIGSRGRLDLRQLTRASHDAVQGCLQRIRDRPADRAEPADS